ncbi:hypothetical protein PLESTB_001157000 [Pleodorina starrii]|uniref:Uncharacterized protein n=1 Tax=Pleodorina starrii TaxID=330485 RepID=A0A9W6BRZ3_9CHLO|nr:hypothetical protein PLESTM_001778900 [Pleodorina starrii]GLC56860.1 hypothetical protein PLESTB_001157000 [Pleodorina starrii]GLC68195.1 hypothetical protein PLESTF_000658800 [Pleodorina starrii]
MQHLRLRASSHRGTVIRSLVGSPCRLACLIASRRCPATNTSDRQLHTRCYVEQDADPLEAHPVRLAFLSVGVSADDLHRASRLEPALLNYTTDRLHGIIDLLLNLGLSGSDIGKVLIAFPQAFQLSLDHHAQPVIEFLRRDVGLGPAEVRTLVTRFPSILGMNVKGQLRPQVAYLASLGFPQESLPELVLSRPLVLGPGIETVISFLRRSGLPRSQMHRLLRSYPLDYRVHLKSFSAAAPGHGYGSGSSSSGGSPPGKGDSSGGGGGRGMGRTR